MVSRNLKQGTKCVVIANNSRHNRPIGSVVTIQRFFNNGGHNDGFTTKEHGEIYFALNDLKLWERTEKDLLEEIEEITIKLEDLNEKIDYLKETGKDAVNIDEFKTYKLNSIISDTEISSEEKTQLILELMGEKKKKKKVKIVKKKSKKDIPENEEVEEMEAESEYDNDNGYGNPDQGYYDDEAVLDNGEEC